MNNRYMFKNNLFMMLIISTLYSMVYVASLFVQNVLLDVVFQGPPVDGIRKQIPDMFGRHAPLCLPAEVRSES